MGETEWPPNWDFPDCWNRWKSPEKGLRGRKLLLDRHFFVLEVFHPLPHVPCRGRVSPSVPLFPAGPEASMSAHCEFLMVVQTPLKLCWHIPAVRGQLTWPKPWACPAPRAAHASANASTTGQPAIPEASDGRGKGCHNSLCVLSKSSSKPFHLPCHQVKRLQGSCWAVPVQLWTGYGTTQSFGSASKKSGLGHCRGFCHWPASNAWHLRQERLILKGLPSRLFHLPYQ